MLELVQTRSVPAPKASRDETSEPARIVVARGDGVGPEIMEAVQDVLAASGANLAFDEIVLGAQAYRAGHKNGVDPSAWDKIKRSDALLKAPLTTPPGEGWKSVNVTLRKALGLFANVRPVRSFEPYVGGSRESVDLVVIRENEEDVYAGIEHQQTDDVVQCLKLMSRRGCERVIRYAFAYARAYGRAKVTCMAKHNIMKMTDGLFVRVFEDEAARHPGIASDVMIVDIGAAKVAARPDLFDVIVTPNLYGDIVSDIAAEVAGSVGLAGSANVGRDAAMFEAVHGSAPDIAGRGVANPSGLLMASAKMLEHIGQFAPAALIRNAWLKTIEDGVHTADVYGSTLSRKRVSTMGFARAVIANLGEEPAILMAGRPQLRPVGPIEIDDPAPPRQAHRRLVGVDVFVRDMHALPDEIADRVSTSSAGPLELDMVTNRGVTVWPRRARSTQLSDHWRCRFKAKRKRARSEHVVSLLARLESAGVEVIKTENLYELDGTPAYSNAHQAV